MSKRYAIRYGNLWRDGFKSLSEALAWASANVRGFYSVVSYEETTDAE